MNRHVGDGVRETRRGGHRRRRSAFTMVELLVVTGVITVLMAILVPTAQQAAKKAKGVICQSRLRTWGVELSAFANELDPSAGSASAHIWDQFYRSQDAAFLCPMATRYQTNTVDPNWMVWERIGCGLGSTFTAWKLPTSTPVTAESGFLFGSYGLNHRRLAVLNGQSRHNEKGNGSNMPVLLDCVSWGAQASSTDGPPRYEGELTGTGIKNCCIDRHDGGINALFLDGSVRKVGLKELWTLDWSPGFDPHNPWTRAGGVQPQDWPQWMREFRDY